MGPLGGSQFAKKTLRLWAFLAENKSVQAQRHGGCSARLRWAGRGNEAIKREGGFGFRGSCVPWKKVRTLSMNVGKKGRKLGNDMRRMA